MEEINTNDEYLSSNYDKLCRLCMHKTNIKTKNFHNLLKINKSNFKTILNLELATDDGLPNIVCSTCYLQSNELFQKLTAFHEQCHLSYRKLREITLKDQEIKIESKEDEQCILEPIISATTTTLSDSSQLVKAEDQDKDIANKPKTKKSYPTKTKKGRQCNVCGKFVKVLSSHILIHTQERPFQCEYCQKMFTTKSNMQSHIKIHLDIRNYKCTVGDCEKAFVSNTSLRKHLLYHTGSKDFGCHLCDRKFNQPDQLRSHLLTHSQKKNFECEICNRKFFLPFNLRDHLRRAHSEKPKCDQCNKVFKTQSYLDIHKRTHTGETPYQCTVCNRKFATGSAFSSHSKSHLRKKQAVKVENMESAVVGVMQQVL